ncbi:16S rRNA (guanine(527)-N(7))-methyltransferase RsmG [Guggenheimella bovis]
MTANEKLARFQEMVLEKNKVMNLTAITDEKEFYEKHILDSMTPLPYFNLKPNDLVADLGTGAGFPGIVLAVLREDVTFHLIDSLKKRLTFLEEVIKELDIKNVELFHGRFEDLGQSKVHRERYDAVVTRAIANLPVLLEYVVPFLKVNGYAYCYKSRRIEEELQEAQNAINILKVDIIETKQYELNNNDRCILKLQKKEKTQKTYPRKAGTPSKNPL